MGEAHVNFAPRSVPGDVLTASLARLLHLGAQLLTWRGGSLPSTWRGARSRDVAFDLARLEIRALKTGAFWCRMHHDFHPLPYY